MPYTVAKAFPDLKVRQSLKVIEEPGTDNYFLLQHLGFWNGPSQLSRFKNDPKVDKAEVLLSVNHLVYGFTPCTRIFSTTDTFISSPTCPSPPRTSRDRILCAIPLTARPGRSIRSRN